MVPQWKPPDQTAVLMRLNNNLMFAQRLINAHGLGEEYQKGLQAIKRRDIAAETAMTSARDKWLKDKEKFRV